jgi:hypothetical protein
MEIGVQENYSSHILKTVCWREVTAQREHVQLLHWMETDHAHSEEIQQPRERTTGKN